MPVYNSILINVKAIVAAFNQEMTLLCNRETSNFAKVRVQLWLVSSVTTVPRCPVHQHLLDAELGAVAQRPAAHRPGLRLRLPPQHVRAR